jgi:hypothetical protein
LGDDEQATAVDAVDEHAREEADEQARNGLREGHDADLEGRSRELDHQPRLREELDEIADVRDDEARPEHPKTLVAQGRKKRFIGRSVCQHSRRGIGGCAQEIVARARGTPRILACKRQASRRASARMNGCA